MNTEQSHEFRGITNIDLPPTLGARPIRSEQDFGRRAFRRKQYCIHVYVGADRTTRYTRDESAVVPTNLVGSFYTGYYGDQNTFTQTKRDCKRQILL